MTPEEIQAMAKGLAQEQAVWYVLSACIGGAIAGLGTYLAEKGKNRATKEDIGEITRAVKEIEAGFNEKLADLQAHHQLRMVAAERRMQAHQEAYIHWLKLMKETAADIGNPTVIEECRVWYTSNCIFLGVRSREAFGDAMAGIRVLEKMRIVPNPDHSEGWESLEKMSKAGNVFLEEVDLPPLSRETSQILAGSTAPT